AHRHHMSFLYDNTATNEISPLSLHDALPIFRVLSEEGSCVVEEGGALLHDVAHHPVYSLLMHRPEYVAVIGESHIDPPSRQDRRSEGTRLNSSHVKISYAVFCLKKKNSRRIS